MEAGVIVGGIILVIGIFLYVKNDSEKNNIIDKLTNDNNRLNSQWVSLKEKYDELEDNFNLVEKDLIEEKKTFKTLCDDLLITEKIIFDELGYKFDKLKGELNYDSEELLLFIWDNEYSEYSFNNIYDVELIKKPLRQFISIKIVKEFAIEINMKPVEAWKLYKNLSKLGYLKENEFEKKESSIMEKHWIGLTDKARFYIKYFMQDRKPIERTIPYPDSSIVPGSLLIG